MNKQQQAFNKIIKDIKDLQIIILLLTLCIIAIPFTSATSFQNLSSDDVLKINLNLTENASEMNIYFNPINQTIDNQELKQGAFSVLFKISDILERIDFKGYINEGDLFPTFTEASITQDLYTFFTIDAMLSAMGYSFDSSDINANPNLLQELIKDNYNNKMLAYGNWKFEKKGNNYKITGDKGARYFNDYRKVFTNSFKAMNYSIAFKIDLTNIKLVNGQQEIEAEIKLNNEILVKKAYLTIEGLTNDTYSPEENISNVSNVSLDKIEGLEFGTKIIVTEEVVSSYTAPSQVTGIQVLNISTDRNTTGDIYFSINKSQVTDKNKVSLYVLEDSLWTKLNTTYLNETTDEYEYKATTPHFSIFMVGEEVPVVSKPSSSSGSSGHTTKIVTSPVVIEESEVPLEEEIKEKEAKDEEIKNTTIIKTKNEIIKDFLLRIFIFTIIIGIIVFSYLLIKNRGIKLRLKNGDKRYNK